MFRAKQRGRRPHTILSAYGPEADRVIRASEEVARDFGHDSIEPEHILVAQHTLRDHPVARMLIDHGAALPDLTRELRILRPRGATPEGRVRFGPPGREVITTAWAICHGSGASMVRAVHLALAVVRMPGTTVRTLLDQLGVDVDELDTALRELLAPDDRGSGSGDPYVDAFTAMLPAPEGSGTPDGAS